MDVNKLLLIDKINVQNDSVSDLKSNGILDNVMLSLEKVHTCVFNNLDTKTNYYFDYVDSTFSYSPLCPQFSVVSNCAKEASEFISVIVKTANAIPKLSRLQNEDWFVDLHQDNLLVKDLNYRLFDLCKEKAYEIENGDNDVALSRCYGLFSNLDEL